MKNYILVKGARENNLKEMTKDREPAPIKKNGTGAISSIGRKSSHS